jgi:phosphatidylglycerol:prolipoprotein diacylglycerol transferase
MMPVFQLGPLALPLPGIILLLGLWLGLLLAEKNAYRSGIQKDHLYNLVFIGLLAGLIGARLSYIIQYPQVFLEDPIGIISRNLGLLDPWGAAVGALLGGLIYGQRKHLSIWHTLDALTPLLAVFSVALGLSHLASGSAFGNPTTLPWSIQL